MSPYAKTIKKTLVSLGANVSNLELTSIVRAGHDMRSPIVNVVQRYFVANPASIDSLTPLEGSHVALTKHDVMLERPYVAISKADWDFLLSEQALYYQMPSGRVVTFGKTESGYCLMPLAKKDAAKVLRQNMKKAA